MKYCQFIFVGSKRFLLQSRDRYKHRWCGVYSRVLIPPPPPGIHKIFHGLYRNESFDFGSSYPPIVQRIKIKKGRLALILAEAHFGSRSSNSIFSVKFVVDAIFVQPFPQLQVFQWWFCMLDVELITLFYFDLQHNMIKLGNLNMQWNAWGQFGFLIFTVNSFLCIKLP